MQRGKVKEGKSGAKLGLVNKLGSKGRQHMGRKEGLHAAPVHSIL